MGQMHSELLATIPHIDTSLMNVAWSDRFEIEKVASFFQIYDMWTDRCVRIQAVQLLDPDFDFPEWYWRTYTDVALRMDSGAMFAKQRWETHLTSVALEVTDRDPSEAAENALGLERELEGGSRELKLCSKAVIRINDTHLQRNASRFIYPLILWQSISDRMVFLANMNRILENSDFTLTFSPRFNRSIQTPRVWDMATLSKLLGALGHTNNLLGPSVLNSVLNDFPFVLDVRFRMADSPVGVIVGF